MSEKEQAQYCKAMMGRIANDVNRYVDSGKPFLAGCDTERFIVASKTQITNDITHLRRELLALKRMVER